MCECGCSMFEPDSKMPGPDGRWYLLMVYPGCQSCDSPAGLDIQLMGPRVAKRDWGIDVRKVPDLAFHEGSAAIAVLHPDILRRKLTASLIGMEVDGGKVDRISSEVAMEEGFDEHFEDAVRETQQNPTGEAPRPQEGDLNE